MIRTGVPFSWYSYVWMCHWMAPFMQCNVDIYSIHSDVTYSLATSDCGGLFSLKVDIKMSSKIEPVLPPLCLKKLCLNDPSLQMSVHNSVESSADRGYLFYGPHLLTHNT